MRILCIGGTRFVGRHFVNLALEAGHDVSFLHSGRTNRGLFLSAREILADRDGGLDALGDDTWDAVVDTCGYVPRLVADSAELLRDRVAHYVFLSSGSVYADVSKPGLDEDAPVHTPPPSDVEEVDADTYGGLKIACEREVVERFAERALIVRAGLIAGPYDSTDRFTYWPVRFARGGRVLAPGRPEAPVQFIDVRDLGAWILRCVEQGVGGTFNATGPAEPLTMASFLEACRDTLNPESELVWMPDDFLIEEDVAPFTGLPLWLPEEANAAGFLTMNCRRAIDAGLTFRPLAGTLNDTLTWHEARPPEEPAAGLLPEEEEELFAAWEEWNAE